MNHMTTSRDSPTDSQIVLYFKRMSFINVCVFPIFTFGLYLTLLAACETHKQEVNPPNKISCEIKYSHNSQEFKFFPESIRVDVRSVAAVQPEMKADRFDFFYLNSRHFGDEVIGDIILLYDGNVKRCAATWRMPKSTQFSLSIKIDGKTETVNVNGSGFHLFTGVED